jgi:amino acid adenylation domain-containing protein/non-ribosomal peptide synthase protein (TIGR01720 family)
MNDTLAKLDNLSASERKALLLLLKRRRPGAFAGLPLGRVRRDEPLPLSHGQQRLWFLAKLDPSSSAYHIGDAVYLDGPVDAAAMEAALAMVVERHESLRTVFGEENGQAVQRIRPDLRVSLRRADLSGHAGDRESAARELVEQACEQPFDLEQGPLLRALLVKLEEERHVFALAIHHIVADEWSLALLIAEFAECYDACRLGREPQLPELPIQYADYAAWQRDRAEAGEYERQLAYWKSMLGDEHPILELPADRPRPPTASDRGATLGLALSDEIAAGIGKLCRAGGATLFMGLLAAFKILLYRYSGQSDLRVGIPIANRNRPEVQGVVGFFVNTQVLRTALTGGMSFVDVLDHVKQAALGAQAHADLPFDVLVDALRPERSLGHNPLFQVMYNHQRMEAATRQALESLRMAPFPRDGRTTQFDLILDTVETGDGKLSGVFTYATDLFDADTIGRLSRHFRILLAAVIAAPERPIGELPLWETGERERLAVPKATRGDHHWRASVHELIGRQAEAKPEATALVCDGESLSYAELEQRSNRLAHRLIRLGVEPGVSVGVVGDRSIGVVVAALAVFKAGGTYVPLDPEAPEMRLRAAVMDAAIELVLAGNRLEAAPAVWLDPGREDLSTEPVARPAVPLHPEHAAYIIYTSGSTGQPKGVAVSHRALAGHCLAMGEVYGLSPDDLCLHFAAPAFDAALEQWIVPLLHGACVVLGAPAAWDVQRTLDEIADRGITCIDLPPAYLAEISRGAAPPRRLPLRVVTSGGEALAREVFELAMARLRPATLVNAYGPTEAVITPLAWVAMAGTVCPTPYAPIGHTVGERAAWVLDADLNPLPPGGRGELCIGGPGLALGYFRRPGMTAERFVPNPYGPPGSRLYRTGDRVRIRKDGAAEYLGRLDRQLKLRGFRIEPGEIESLLLRQEGVTEALVVVQAGSTGKRLVAYVAGEKAAVSPESLKRSLKNRLPGYMVPAQIEVLERLPRKSSGKLDLAALPEPGRTDPPFIGPRTAAEKLLAEIWRDVLNLDRVGLNDNFFDLGGDSIVSLQVVSRARQAGLLISPRDMFQHQTVAALAAIARAAEETMGEPPPAAGAVPLTPIQREFFETPVPNRQRWNQSLLLECARPLDPRRLAAALQRLMDRHEALRLRFRHEGEWQQWHADPAEARCQEILWLRTAADAGEIERISEEAQGSLDLEQGPLLRAVSMAVSGGGSRLLLVVHHLAVDGVSWRILLDELQAAYDHPERPPPPRTSSFQAWALRLRDYAGSEAILSERRYWSDLLTGVRGDLPRDHPVESGVAADAATVTVALEREATRRLLQEAPQAYRARMGELLLTALARTLCRWSGQDCLLVDMEGHGREDLFAGIDLSRTVGWFTSTYPVRLAPHPDIGASIKSVKESLRQVPEGGIGYGVIRFLCDESLRTGFDSLPRPRVSFNYLGQFDQSFGAGALFVPASERRGQDQDAGAPLSHWFDINGQIYEGRLSLHWTYLRTIHRTETVEALAAEFHAELLALIEHCAAAHGVTPSDFPLARLNQAQLDALPVAPEDIEDVYPLTPMQQGMLFHSLEQPGAYVTRFEVEVEGLDRRRFREAWRYALRRHGILRTGFHWRGDVPVQVVQRRLELPLEELDWRSKDIGPEQREKLCRAEAGKGFELDRPPLFRLTLVSLDEARHLLIWTSHHLLLDGWASARLLAEVLAHYRGEPPATPAANFRDYIAWLQRRDSAAEERYWRKRLEPLRQATHLAKMTSAGKSGTGHGLLHSRFEPASFRRLQRFVQERRITLGTLVLGAWALLLGRHTGQETVAFGVTVSGRPGDLPRAEEMVGLFINTLPLILSPASTLKAGEWLSALQADNLELQEHGHTPLYDIQRWWEHGDAAGQGLFDTLLVFENYPVDEVLRRSDGLRFGPSRHEETTNYPLTLTVQSGDTLEIAFDYQRERFDEASVSRIQTHFERLLLQLAEAPARCLGEMELLSEVEWEALRRWNAWEGSAAEVALAELIRRQAEARPAGVAVVCGGERLSYGELEARSNRLARRLGRLGVVAETRVGVVLERTADLVVALLGILKAGGAFVPLAAGLPAGRLSRLLADAGVRVVLLEAGEEGREAVPAGVARLVRGGDWGEGEPASAPAVEVHPEQLAYLIYTSGSTGQPKAVAVGHGALSRHIQAAGRWYGLGPDDRCLHFAAFSFDAALEQWAAPLAHGATLVLGQPGWSGEDTAAAVRREGISVIYPPTPHLLHLADAVAAQGERLRLRICTVGGEAVAWDSLARLRRVLRPARLINGYGPTETVITPLAWTAGPEDAAPATGAYVPIGRPLGQRSAWVLNRDLQPVPPGLEGELYIGGPCLARGYHGRPGLTAERFLPDPFGAPGSRLYRSGDRVRQGPDGTVAYLGRTDQQIKLRGHRIEPGEIEAALLAQPGVREAVVVLREDHGRRYLAGYVGGAADLSADGLRRALAAELPAPLVPSALIVLARLPRTAHGKVDRPALPAPAPAAGAIAPRTAAERQLAAIWQELLGRPGPGPELAPRLLRAEPRGEAEGQSRGIGVGDNFFELGGDSILAIQVVSRARQAGLHFTPQDLFRHPTLESLARHAQTVARPAIDPGPVTGDVPLTPIQAEFFALDLPDRRHWNQALLLRPRQPLHPGRLAAALDHLVRHHDSLRLRYRATAQGWEQRYAAPDPAPDQTLLWQAAVADAAAIEAQAQRAQRSLDLADGPLLRAVHLRVGDGSERLLLVIHHLVVDGVSWRILLEDLQAAYTQLGQHLVPRLPAKTSAYRDWARRLAGYAGSAALAGELDYWESQLQGADPHWPADPPAGADPAGSGGVSLRLDRAATRQLLHEAGAAYRSSLQDLLLTALARVLCRWSGRPDVLIALEGHGREDLFDDIDLSRTVGWFTSIYPVRLRPSAPLGASSGQAQDLPQDGLGDALLAVKDQLRQVPHHGLGYGLLKHLAPAAWRARLAALPVPAVAFNYLGQFDASFDPRHSLWLPAAESAGDDRAPAGAPAYAFELNSEIYDGELHLTWCYDPARYRQPTVQALAQTYLNELDALRAHCLSGVCRVSPTDFPLARLTQPQLDALHLPWNHIDDLFPLSPLQQGILFHALEAPEAGFYLTQFSAEIKGLDVERFKAGWQEAMRRHDILRASLLWESGLETPLQVVHRRVELPWEERDWRGRELTPEALAEVREAEYARGVELDSPPLFRLLLVRLGEDRHYLVWTGHHVLLDGWSQSRLLGEVLQWHRGAADPAASGGRYRDYIAWLAKQDRAAAEAFWRDQLATLPEPTLLSSALPRPEGGAGHGFLRRALSREQTRSLRQFAERQRITLNTLVQGAWTVLLCRYTGSRTVVFGTTVAGRPADLAGVESMLGLFINTLPVIHELRPGQPAGDWLRELQDRNVKLREHEHTPLYDIQRWAGQAGRGLFDCILVFENYPVDPALTVLGQSLTVSSVEQSDTTNYALTIDVTESDVLEIGYDYARERFRECDILRLSGHLEHLLSMLAQAADQPVGGLALTGSGPDRPRLFRTANDHGDQPPWMMTNRQESRFARMPPEGDGIGMCRMKSAPGGFVPKGEGEQGRCDFHVEVPDRLREWPLHAQIRRQAEAAPDAAALIAAEGELSYGEMEARANRLAHRLIRLGVGPEVPVGVVLGRCREAVVAALGIWKAGGIYVPLDPECPRERLNHLLEDASIRRLICDSGFRTASGAGGAAWPALDILLEIDKEDLSGEPAVPPPVDVHPQHLAYVIYTSGSTGHPKGVAVSHGALAEHCRGMAEIYGMEADDRALHFASPAFDAAIEQWAVPLLSGACVVLMGREPWSAGHMRDQILAHGITRLDLPPAYLDELAAGVTGGLESPLRSVTSGGEALPRRTFESAMRKLCPPMLVNAYGPTEAVITPLAWTAAPGTACDTAIAPIGVAVGERTAYVLDADLNLLPPGVAGELYLGGAGLARGYLNRPGLTAERFLPDPFGAAGDRLYRTGDRARVLDDGTLEYLGRLDRQVKIRGFRIEPEEIEARLLAYPGVAEAAVQVKGGAVEKRLVAHVSGFGTGPLPDALKHHLRTYLPDYMVPARIIGLDRLPRLPSGKVDRRSLPEPEFAAPPRIEPSTEAERRMAALWREVLNLERVGLTDNFFDLGGHSLLALRLVDLAKRRLNLKLTLPQVLQSPTIEGLLKEARAATPLIALNRPACDAPPLYCIHPAGGTVFCYHPLARALTRPVRGILYPGFLDASWQVESLEDLAEAYARLLLSAQPAGALHLLGWSLGGAIAMELAHVLEGAGREVAFLGLVDSYAPGFDEQEDPREESEIEDLCGFLKEALPGFDADAFRRRARRDFGAPGFQQAGLRGLLKEFAGESQPATGLAEGADLTLGFEAMQRLTTLAKTWRVKPVRIEPHFWWSLDGGELAVQAQTLLETGLTRRGRLSARVPVSHSEIVRAPEFLAAMGGILDSARGRERG